MEPVTASAFAVFVWNLFTVAAGIVAFLAAGFYGAVINNGQIVPAEVRLECKIISVLVACFCTGLAGLLYLYAPVAA